MTLDGKIASFSGDSKWVTGEKAREHTHFLRKKYRGILVGIGTVLADDPMLNCRIENGVDPVRIVCDSHLQIPLECQLVKTAKNIETIVCYAEENEEKQKALMEVGVQLIKAEKDGQVDLEKLMMELGSMEIDSVLVEGGRRHPWFLFDIRFGAESLLLYCAEDDWRQRCIIAGFGKRN